MPRCNQCFERQPGFALKKGMCNVCYESSRQNVWDPSFPKRRERNLKEMEESGEYKPKGSKTMTQVKTYVRAHATRMVENGILNITGANTLKILGLLAPDGYTMTQKMHNMVVPRMTAPKYNEMEIQDFAVRFADEIRQIMEGSFWKQ